MKKFLKEHGILILAFSTLIFIIWIFFIGGIEKISNIFTIEQTFWLLAFVLGVLLLFFIKTLIKSVMWWKVSDKWCDNIKAGDKAYLSTSNGGEDVEVLDADGEYIIVKSRVHKSRIYKPYK